MFKNLNNAITIFHNIKLS